MQIIHRLICPETNPSQCRLHATGGRYAQNSVADIVQIRTKGKQSKYTLEIAFALVLCQIFFKEVWVLCGYHDAGTPLESSEGIGLRRAFAF
jgi:hypothetical protein